MGKLKIVTILGARPQFIKAAAVSSVFSKYFDEVLVHTGQHYDPNMSDVFFEELNIPNPKYHLNIGSGSHGAMTGAMLVEIEKVLEIEKPDFVLVYGDTNSTIAGALAASKILIPVIHVEAGLRSFNKAMPEEQNRILTDHISDLLFVPTQTAVDNLKNEGITKGVHLVGDVMYDGILHFAKIAREKSTILNKLQLKEGDFLLCTIHRAENTNSPERLASIFTALNACGELVVLPLHPRTLKYINDYGLQLGDNIRVIEPVGYLDMVRLESTAKKIVTDSGGIQKEAFFLGIPCITMRDETEWVETVENGWNIVVGADEARIVDAIRHFNPTSERKSYFGKGNASQLMVNPILNYKNEGK
ncbi:non-hydrolyzing UDP-N-acetylglucosamine 2-epimerase [Fluviicola sp.]|jgi:UDP-GlcNAc3NAcA epimerase|uniref:non-hydrolyzing UDP-N-acetylglucosamine 2-epimerase n=1 Tax=Fluviicola sp. TaxID=1917219 RepID=UPI0028339DC6|nr:UDP-N-acetylglucosamine 2-epimerase (non-hydrolyzing) [Fluviicola sp.]MDR0801627.1 UDP-N-acetylglucosamine 2-epimerase (non-hydrolyzing) [Fluviicola sp.]